MSDIIPTGWSIVGIGDFNGDGISDILLRSSSGEVTDWLGQANGGFANSNFGAQPGLNWQVAGTGDFTGDGKDDVLWSSTAAEITDWLATTNGAFTGNFENA